MVYKIVTALSHEITDQYPILDEQIRLCPGRPQDTAENEAKNHPYVRFRGRRQVAIMQWKIVVDSERHTLRIRLAATFMDMDQT